MTDLLVALWAGLLWLILCIGVFIAGACTWLVAVPLAGVMWRALRHGMRAYFWALRVKRGAVRECGAAWFGGGPPTHCVLPLDHQHYTDEEAHAGVWLNNGSRVRWDNKHSTAWVQGRRFDHSAHNTFKRGDEP